MSITAPWRVFTVEAGSGFPRVDTFVAKRVLGISRRQVQKMISAQEITVNGKKTAKGVQLGDGARVEMWVEPVLGRWPPLPCPETPIDVVYYDDDIIVINKQAGIPSTPLTPQEEDTLAGAVVARFAECGNVGRSPGDGGLIQRLDWNTSGLVIAARSQKTHDSLVHMQSFGNIEKKYIALVQKGGKELPPSVERKLLPMGVGRAGVRVSKERCDPISSTKLELIRDCGDTCLVEATIHRGQRHQIRAHLASAGFPIVGDQLYGNMDNLDNIHRLQLHAAQIHLIHPSRGVPAHFEAPLPDDFLIKHL